MAGMTAALFNSREDARKAVHALRDHGIDEDSISVLAVADDGSGKISDMDRADRVDAPGKDDGISTTTPEDAGKGAAEGAVLGAGLGLAAALASIFIPGFGVVAAGGALATALSGAAVATAGGMVVGGVTGYLADMGVPSHAAEEYTQGIKQGGVLVSVHDAEDVNSEDIHQIFMKYNGRNAGTYAGTDASSAADPDDLDATNRRLNDDRTNDTSVEAQTPETMASAAPAGLGSEAGVSVGAANGGMSTSGGMASGLAAGGLAAGGLAAGGLATGGTVGATSSGGASFGGDRMDQQLDSVAGDEGSASTRVNDPMVSSSLQDDPDSSITALDEPTGSTSGDLLGTTSGGGGGLDTATGTSTSGLSDFNDATRSTGADEGDNLLLRDDLDTNEDELDEGLGATSGPTTGTTTGGTTHTGTSGGATRPTISSG